MIQPVQKDVTRNLEYTGQTAALQSIDIRARVPGFLQEMHFEPRAKVKAGDLLFVIDPRQYEASVKEAKAKLDGREASSKLAQTEVQIAQQLESKEAISVFKLDKRIAERDLAAADVELAEAALDNAKLNLEWTKVTSPIDGRVSRNKVDIGNLVGATEKTLLTTVVNDDPIYAYFNVSELDLLPIMRRYSEKKADRSSEPTEKTPIFLGLADEKGYPHKGHLDFTETTVDPSTGTIQVRGIFPNPDGLLLAGMFVRVQVPVEKQTALLIPDIAVQFDQGGTYVLVVDGEDVVQHKRVKTGMQVGDMRVIETGISHEDRVITTGVLRARPGSKVKPTAGPTSDLRPGSSEQEKRRDK
ncbi:MAG: efflux RND transporter periplasmic adaptor subunit [Desulfomonilaceae bacterium]|nr:efflux RND transporter periplasmic adaptor subunit [Desulfomonilaceae bacterium]